MTDEKRIRERAYEIWESAGRPEGEHDTHWTQAEREVAATRTGSRASEDEARPVPKAGKKAEGKSPTPTAPDGGSTPAEAAAAAKSVGKSAEKPKDKKKAAAETASTAPAASKRGSAPARPAKSDTKGKAKKA
ncbi:DUF2934 domain-containing protein [Roseomonas indoligenes]|uniref:DUF2934 domain-containing protein n=1 Tax=Roseomonas indoligenes TaxID=2820811 RepID=A0A940MVF1_9PROT|nr:DUF2934 domain-containing protein [Pararoseomonas indoligenes]MBP0494898.1 DUF2934 domain-containing protein [Pararoseomonas indoligenes]